MSPARKGVVSDKLAARLVKAAEDLAAAKVERDAAIVAALRAGGSYRQVGRLVDMDQASILAIGRAHGWPDAKELAHRERMKTDQEYRTNYLYGSSEALRRPTR